MPAATKQSASELVCKFSLGLYRLRCSCTQAAGKDAVRKSPRCGRTPRNDALLLRKL